jgi:hypothetical protein
MEVLRGQRQDRGDGRRRAHATRPVLAGGDGAEPAGVQRPLRRVLFGAASTRRTGRRCAQATWRTRSRPTPRRGPRARRANVCRRAGRAAGPEEEGHAAVGQDAAAGVAAVLGLAQGQRVRVLQLRAHRRHRLQQDAV